MSTARRIAAIFLLAVSGSFLAAAGISQALNAVIGTPEKAVQNTLAVITTPSTSTALAKVFVDQLAHDNPPGDYGIAIVENRAALVKAVAMEIRSPETQALARQIAFEYFNAQKSGTVTIVVMRPLLLRLTAAMHAVDPRIPADPPNLTNTAIDVKPDNPAITTIDSLGMSMWFNIAVGLGLALVVSRFAIRNPFRRKLALSLAIGLPSLSLISIGSQLSSFFANLKLSDANLHVVITQLAARIGSALIKAGIYSLVAGALVVLAWIGYERWSSNRKPTVIHSELPTPPAA